MYASDPPCPYSSLSSRRAISVLCKIVWGRSLSEQLETYNASPVDFEAVNSYHFLILATNQYNCLRQQSRVAMRRRQLYCRSRCLNRSAMSSNSERSALRAFPMRFASSISLERAVALVFCESVLDSAFEFVAPFFRVSELDWAFEFFFEFVFFELKLDWRLDVSRTSPPGIDAKLGMCVVCVLCVDANDRLSELISDLPWTVF